MHTSFTEKLQGFLNALDKKFQEKGLFPEETEARQAARSLVVLAKVFLEQCEEDLFLPMQKDDLSVIRKLRSRMHLLESDSKAFGLILDQLRIIAAKQSEMIDFLRDKFPDADL